MQCDGYIILKNNNKNKGAEQATYKLAQQVSKPTEMALLGYLHAIASFMFSRV